jgi:hypothetical protein
VSPPLTPGGSFNFANEGKKVGYANLRNTVKEKTEGDINPVVKKVNVVIEAPEESENR